MNPPPTLPSDRQLLDAARRGDDTAWAELVQRHRPAVAAIVGRGRSARRRLDEVVAAARSRLLGDPAPEGTPDLRAVRPAMIAAHTDGFYGPRFPGVLPAGDDPTPPIVGDNELLALAFATLPEPWQTVLWHRFVDELDAEDVAPFVGRATSDVDELVATARRGLTDAFFREYERLGPFDPVAASIVPLLAGYHRSTLSAAEHDLVEDHLRLDHIAVAPPLEPPAPGGRADSFAAPDPALAPPTLRRHDAVDSRRLLDLVSLLEGRLAPAIAPGVKNMSTDSAARSATAPVVTTEADAERRRRWAAIAAVGLVIVGVLGAAVIVRNSLGDDSAADGTDGQPVATDASGETIPVDPATTDPDGEPVTTPEPSTSLVLRPEAETALNTITLVVDDDAEPLGFAPAQAGDVTVSASSPAPVFAGGTGTIDLLVANAGDGDRTVGFTFSLPRGVRFETSTGGTCIDPDDASPRCTVDVAGGASETVAVGFRLETSIVGRLEVDGDLVEPLITPIVVTPDLVHSSVGRGDVVVIGNTVTRCDAAAARRVDIDCAAVEDGTGEVVNRWDVPIEFVGAASQFGLFNSSSAVLDVPEDAEIVAAHLYWSGDLDERGSSVPDDGRNTTIALGLPGGRVQTIEAGLVVLGDVDASQYLGSNDVTELVAAGGSGSYTVGNVQTVEVQGSYGAWALVVVFDDEESPRRHRIVTRPFEWVAPPDDTGQTYEYEVDLPVPAVSGETGQLDVFALEGELGFDPERFSAGGTRLGGENPFDSSIVGDRLPDGANSLGVDVDTYDLTIDAPDGLLPIRATSERDGVRIAVLGLTVDLAS